MSKTSQVTCVRSKAAILRELQSVYDRLNVINQSWMSVLMNHSVRATLEARQTELFEELHQGIERLHKPCHEPEIIELELEVQEGGKIWFHAKDTPPPGYTGSNGAALNPTNIASAIGSLIVFIWDELEATEKLHLQFEGKVYKSPYEMAPHLQKWLAERGYGVGNLGH